MDIKCGIHLMFSVNLIELQKLLLKRKKCGFLNENQDGNSDNLVSFSGGGEL